MEVTLAVDVFGQPSLLFFGVSVELSNYCVPIVPAIGNLSLRNGEGNGNN